VHIQERYTHTNTYPQGWGGGFGKGAAEINSIYIHVPPAATTTARADIKSETKIK